MADKRAFATLDVGYLDNPKLEALLVAMPRAVLMHVRSILYASQHLTDGEVTPSVIQLRTGGSVEDTQALIQAGLWHPPGHDCEQCPQPADLRVYVHNYLEHNRSKASANRLSDRGKAGAEARWGNATSTATGNATSIPSGNAQPDNKQCTDRQTDSSNGRTSSQKRRRLTDDFSPTDAHASKAKDLGVDLQAELDKFKNHYIGKGQPMADWSRTFHNWLSKAAEYNQGRPSRPQTPQSSFDPWASDWSEDDYRKE